MKIIIKYEKKIMWTKMHLWSGKKNPKKSKGNHRGDTEEQGEKSTRNSIWEIQSS